MAYLNYKGNHTYLSIKDNYGRVRNHIYFIVAKTGYGKGLFAERILEAYHRAGYTVICIADPKDEQELAYAMFNPIEIYQTNTLRKIGKPIQSKKVKLYHPFTFDIPKTKLPDINFFTIPLKKLGRAEWSLIAESAYDTDTIRLCLNASHNISNEDGIYAFLHYLQNIIKGKKDKKQTSPDPKNFYLSATSGTMKSLQDISNYLQPFKRNYFLSRQNSPYNLDWKEIINDNEHYHVFLNTWCGITPHDDKIKTFVVLYCLRKIVENVHRASNPVIIFVPEVKKLMPFRPRGFQEFLAESMKESLSMLRSMGEGGISAVLDTQVYADVDESVRRTSSRMFLGELSADDIEKISKALNYRRDVKKLLNNMSDPNSYIWVGNEDLTPFRMWLPSHMHCEEPYSFIKMCQRYHPKQMRSYDYLIKEMNKTMEFEHKKFAEMIKKQKAEEKKRKELEKKKKEEKDKDEDKIKEKVDKEVRKLSKLERKQKVKEAYLGNTNITHSELAKIGEVKRSTITKLWLPEIKEQTEHPADNSDIVIPNEY